MTDKPTLFDMRKVWYIRCAFGRCTDYLVQGGKRRKDEAELCALTAGWSRVRGGWMCPIHTGGDEFRTEGES